MKKILVTGANGFIGSHFIDSFKNDYELIGAYRAKPKIELDPYILINEIDQNTNWENSLEKIDCVVHCAARVHVMKDICDDPVKEFRNTNTLGTLRLARQAAELGVKRFVFISTVKVNGEFTEHNTKFTPDDSYVPIDPYGQSKYEAEKGLQEISKATDMEVVIIRPPLVYGPNVRANFRSMMKWVNKGVPLPFGSINNKRSLISLTNLGNFMNVCINHPNAANEIFLISDGEDVSTTELLNQIGIAFNKKTKLIPIPVFLMKLAAKIIGKKDVADRVFGNLQLDSSKANTLLNWKPVVTMEQELKMTVGAYLNE